MTSAILTDGLGKKFRRVNALNDLNLSVPEGALFAMVGPNGAGKTTLIKLLMNIFDPTAGHAEVLGADSRRIRGAFFAAIGYVSENQEIPAWMRVGEFLAYLRPFYPTWDRSLEEELCRQFELPLDRKLSDLSRGVRMKAVLAGSLAYRPQITGVTGGPIGYGASFQVQTPDAASIASAVLIPPGTPTHAFDNSAREVGLSFALPALALSLQALF